MNGVRINSIAYQVVSNLRRSSKDHKMQDFKENTGVADLRAKK